MELYEMVKNLSDLDAYNLTKEVYDDKSWKVDDDFAYIHESFETYGCEFTKEQKQKIGKWLKENCEEDLIEFYDDYWVDHRTKEEYEADNAE